MATCPGCGKVSTPTFITRHYSHSPKCQLFVSDAALRATQQQQQQQQQLQQQQQQELQPSLRPDPESSVAEEDVPSTVSCQQYIVPLLEPDTCREALPREPVLPGEQEHVGMEDDFPLVDDQENETVRTNVAQAKPIVPWYKQEQNKTHFEAANRIFPFFDGMCEDENNDYVEVVKWSMSLPPCDTSIVMSEGMKTVALLVTKTRLTQIHSSFRSQYRLAYTPDIRRTADSPTVDRIMKLSKDEEAYEFYFKSFLRFVIPPLTFKNCIKQEPTSLSSKVDRMASSIKGARGGKDMVPFITVEEETLGLFFLDNYSDVWQAQLTQKVNTVTDVFPKYTTGKKNTLLAQKQKGVMIAKGHRLSNEGTARWNELYEKVTADRKIIEREVWEQILLNAMSTEATNGKKRPRAAVAQVAPPTTRLRFSMPE